MEMSLSKLKGHQRPITSLTLYDENLLSTGKDGNIVIWNDQKIIKSISCSGSISVSGINKDIIYTGSADGTLNLWTLNGDKVKSYLTVGPIKNISCDSDNLRYYILTKKLSKPESILLILDFNLEKIKEHDLDGEYNSLLKVNNNIICGSCDGLLKIFDLQLNLINKNQVHKKEITNIKVDYKKEIIVTSSLDNSLYIFNINTFELINSYKHTASILSFCIHENKNIIAIGGGHDKMTIASSSNNGQFEIVLIDSLNCQKLFDFDSKHFGPVNSVLFEPNKIITGGEDGYINYWLCEDDWINLKTKEFKIKEFNELKKLLSESKVLLDSLIGKNNKNQRRNLKKKIDKLEVKIPILSKEIENYHK